MKRNAIRLEKLEDRIIRNRSDIFRLSDFEILERIQELEFKNARMPTYKFIDMKNISDKSNPVFSPKVSQRMRDEQAERNAEISSMHDVELDDHLDELIIENDMRGTFEDMSEKDIKDHNKTKKETLC